MSGTGGGGFWNRLTSGTPAGESADSLSNRITNGWLQANDSFRQLLDEARLSNVKPWALPDDTQTLFHISWVTLVYWTYARGLLETGGQSASVRAKCEELSGLAESAALDAVKMRSILEVDGRIQKLRRPLSLPSLQGLDAGWGAYEALQLQVESDLQTLRGFGITKRYEPFFRQIATKLHPVNAVLEHLIKSRQDAQAPANAPVEAERAVQDLFEIGQYLWAPYLLGSIYENCRRQEPTLEDLELPGLNPWALTDPEIAKKRQKDRASEQLLVAFWLKIQNVASAQQLARAIEQALAQGQLKPLQGQAYNDAAPWPSKFLVAAPVAFGQRQFSTGDLCAPYVNKGSDMWFVEMRRAGRVNEEQFRALNPVQLAFDPWILTDPQVKAKHLSSRSRKKAERELEDLWAHIDPQAVAALKKALDQSVAARWIRRRTGQAPQYAPWPSQYLVRRPLKFGNRSFQVGDVIVPYIDKVSRNEWHIELRKTPTKLRTIRELLGQ